MKAATSVMFMPRSICLAILRISPAFPRRAAAVSE
jgi:hypothetical protein